MNTGNNSIVPPVVTDHVPDLTTKVSSSVSGFVTDEFGHPFAAASVQVGNITQLTNHFGYFEIKNVQVVKEAATVTVTCQGNRYYKSIKTYVAREGKSAFFRIKLLPIAANGTTSNSGTFDAAAGGIISTANGLSISFPANSLVDPATGAAYTGTAVISLFYIDPTSSELVKIMPGDLRGIDTSGHLTGLASYGMMVAKIWGNIAGLPPLQIASGKKATISFPIPASISGTAPATIPLWYFDENNGLWKEEGSAVKTGNNYVGDVGHFSFWNCDCSIPSLVNFDCTVLSHSIASVIPLENAIIKLTDLSIPWNFSSVGFTNNLGYVGGRVPANSQFLLEVFPDNSCTGSIYAYNFSTAGTDISLGEITINNTQPSVANITGSVTNCNNAALNSGYMMLYNGLDYFTTPINNGTYSISLALCNSSQQNLVLTAIDPVTGWHSSDINQVINPGANTISSIQACTTAFFSAVSNGYFYRPGDSWSITNRAKMLDIIDANSVSTELADMGNTYKAVFTVDPSTNLVTVTAAAGAAYAPYTQFDAALPSTNPGYTPQWINASQCNNVYDPQTHTYYVRYGYLDFLNRWCVAEEIIQVL